MGCDIHAYAESQSKHGWWNFDRRVASDRDYTFFSVIADVRTSDESNVTFKERGIPEDMSTDMKTLYEDWGTDAHSASYLTLTELRTLLGKVVKIEGMIEAARLPLVKADFADGKFKSEHLYPYCAATNAKGWVQFQLHLPLIEKSPMLLRWIKSLEEMPGSDDEKRVVFWFDN